jgi:hypothetical protein
MGHVQKMGYITMAIKGKDTILNGLMDSAASLIAAKIEYNKLVLEQFQEKGDTARIEALSAAIDEMTMAMNVIEKWSGCWA